MSELLNLVQKFETKSSAQAKIIEDQIEKDLAQLNKSMSEKLAENKIIIDNATTSLSKSTKLIYDYETRCKDLIDDSLLKLQTHTNESLQQHKLQMSQIMSDHLESMNTIVTDKQTRFIKLMTTKLWVVVLLSLLLMALGFVNGLMWG